MSDPISFTYESTPGWWRCNWDPEGHQGFGKSRAQALAALYELCDYPDGEEAFWLAIVAAIEPPSDRGAPPAEPTEGMVIAGFECEAWDALGDAVLAKKGWPYSCRESADCVRGIYRAMIAAAPDSVNAGSNGNG